MPSLHTELAADAAIRAGAALRIWQYASAIAADMARDGDHEGAQQWLDLATASRQSFARFLAKCSENIKADWAEAVRRH